MRRLITVFVLVLLIASGAVAQTTTDDRGVNDAITQGEFAQMVMDVALGYDNLDGYLEATPYFGAMVGRVGNRIADGIGQFVEESAIIAQVFRPQAVAQFRKQFLLPGAELGRDDHAHRHQPGHAYADGAS